MSDKLQLVVAPRQTKVYRTLNWYDTVTGQWKIHLNRGSV